MSDLTRRAFGCAALMGLAAPALAACGSDGPRTLPVATADVPVGGGVVLTDDKLVVTQPTEGEFKCFTAVCTHEGCTVGRVESGEIRCPCHGSRFSAADGSVVRGPADDPLEERPVRVEGGKVVEG
jgi:Rieske Fe-S protein